MAENFGSGVVGGVVLIDPATGLPYKATGGGGGGGAVDSVNGQTGVVVLDAGDVGARPDDWEPSTDDVLPAQADQGGKVIMTDGSTASWQPLPPVPPTVATIVYTADDEARPVGADIVFWVPENPSLGDPENAAVDDLVIRSVADAVQGLNGTVGLWRGTQLEYDAIVSPNPNVVYVVLED